MAEIKDERSDPSAAEEGLETVMCKDEGEGEGEGQSERVRERENGA